MSPLSLRCWSDYLLRQIIIDDRAERIRRFGPLAIVVIVFLAMRIGVTHARLEPDRSKSLSRPGAKLTVLLFAMVAQWAPPSSVYRI